MERFRIDADGIFDSEQQQVIVYSPMLHKAKQQQYPTSWRKRP